MPRFSLSCSALAVALTSTLNPKLRTTRGARVRIHALRVTLIF
ncbi:hypothetical protein T36_1157 [Helicobacter cinaedi]|nr:hypothetical protein [Helicobacter cinaedi]BDB64700.1 hypothetical protein T36_1157 [Helicobacter cinaedi]